MLRIVRLICQLNAVILVGMVGLLLITRSNTHDQVWVIFSVSHRYDAGSDVYRMFSDGSHVAKIASITDPALVMDQWEQPGWMTMEVRVRGLRHLALLHLTGHQEFLLEGNYGWIRPTYFDADQQRVYLTTTDPLDAFRRELWLVDLASDTRTRVHVPLDPIDYRTTIQDGRYIFWSGGDLFRFEYGNPPRITQVTYRGDVLQFTPAINQPGWVYYYVGSAKATEPQALYRMRVNGTDEQVVAEHVWVLRDALPFWSYDTTVIYYWGGEVGNPHLIHAKPDGSEPIPLPITPFKGWFQIWSPDNQWFYYRQWASEISGYFSPSDLYRVHRQTGETQLLLENRVVYQTGWTPDGAWLLILTEGENGFRRLYRMRADGSETTLLWDRISPSPAFIIDAGLLFFESWSDSDLRLRALDLATFQITSIEDGLPSYHGRSLIETLPIPDGDWEALGLLALGIIVGAVGYIPTCRRKRFFDGHPLNFP
ncbi:MAG: DUF5050 domain-containing protein [Anaerolineae bacterium]|nr:MAG: DUF5050 domain-containing protein [Anaerolineae bacterium]